MKWIRIILFSPLAILRLLFILIMSGYVVTVGLIWMKISGFSRKMQQWVMGTWGKSICFFLGIRIIRNKIPEIRNFILMPNHRSYLDIFIIAALTPSAMVAKEELKKWPFGKVGIKITNSILVDRSEIKSLIKTMNAIEASVKKEIPVTLFPEGTSYRGPLTKPFKNGSFKIAADTAIPIIPMAIHYKDENDAWVGNDTFLAHFFRQMGKPVSKVFVEYGNPVNHADYKILQQETKNQIDFMLQKMINDLI